jgi:DNA polymerase-3 subunit beta
MKVVVDRKAMLEAFGLAASVCKSKSPKPILRHVLMTASEGGTTLCGTDLELYVRVPVPGCTVVSPGRAVLDGEKVKAALDSYPDDQVRIETADSKVLVAGARSKSSLASDDPDLFPGMPDFPEGSPSWSILPADLSLLADRTAFATDPKSMKFALGGCLVEFGDGSLGLVGSDGKRLSRWERPAEGGLSDIKAVVPPDAFKRCDQVFGKSDARLSIAFSAGDVPNEPNLMHARSPAGEVLTRLVSGRFPPWRSMIPPGTPHVAKAPVGVFRSAVDCASIVVSELTKAIDLTFRTGTILVAGAAADLGECDAEREVEYAGPEIVVRLDARNLREVLAKLPEKETLSVRLIDGECPVVLSLDDGWIHAMAVLTREKK